MPLAWSLAALLLGAVGTLIFSTLTYSLRDVSRPRLADFLTRHGRERLVEPTIAHLPELIFATAVARLASNTIIALCSVWVGWHTISNFWIRDIGIFLLASLVCLVFSVTIPLAISKYGGNEIVGSSVGVLNVIRVALTPLNWIMRLSDAFVRSAAGATAAPKQDEIAQRVEDDILSAVEEGTERGVVDEQEREMIHSVIQFHDSAVAEVMTERAEIVAVSVDADFEQVRAAFELGGHSRIPVYEQNLDHVIGILHARDLLIQGYTAEKPLEMRKLVRPGFFIAETAPLGDVLREMRQRRAHLAIVLDEYGGTAGLVTFENILTAIVGGSSDAPAEDANLFKRIDDKTVEADARIEIAEFNRLSGLQLSDDDGYATLGGFVLATLGQIPEKNTVIEHDGLRLTVLDAEPQRINRIRVEQLAPAPISSPE
jgi:magnesium and cobalt exporter, CNNM family